MLKVREWLNAKKFGIKPQFAESLLEKFQFDELNGKIILRRVTFLQNKRTNK